MNLLRGVLVIALLCLPAAVMAQSANVLAPDYVMQNLKKGVTKRADVLRLFGEPVHSDVQVSSETGSIETLIYGGAGPQATPKRKKSSGGFGAFLRTARGVANDVAGITGKSYGYGSDTARVLNKAENLANTADRFSASAASDDASEPAARGLTLTIQLRNGVVTSYEMR